jgi:hypothetical protein
LERTRRIRGSRRLLLPRPFFLRLRLQVELRERVPLCLRLSQWQSQLGFQPRQYVRVCQVVCRLWRQRSCLNLRAAMPCGQSGYFLLQQQSMRVLLEGQIAAAAGLRRGSVALAARNGSELPEGRSRRRRRQFP